MDFPTQFQHFHSLVFQHYYYLLPGVALVSYVFYQRFLHPFANVPGPFLASLTSFWLARIASRGDMKDVFKDLHSRLGPVVRIGPNEVSVADLAAFRTIYGTTSKFRKADWYSVWQGHRKFDLFGGRDIKVHAQQRKLVARAFSMETLKGLEPYVTNMVQTFCRQMEEQVGKKVDLGYWIQLFAFDVIGEITWSKSFSYMDSSSDHGLFAAIDRVFASGTWLGYVPWVYWTHDRLMPFIGNWLGINNRHSGLRSFALRETQERKDRPVEKQDMIGRFLDTHTAKSDEFSYEDVISMGTTLISAGADTTAVSTRSIVYHLLRNPSKLAKLRSEIDGARTRSELSDPVEWEEANKLKYLQACIYEGLRMHPALAIALPRVVPAGGISIASHFIPESSVVSTSAWVLNYNKEVFGPDADEFNPDRWLAEDDKGDKAERVSNMHRYMFSFGGGSRACIGKNIGLLEMSKLIPTMFLRYNVELWEGKPWTNECGFFAYQKDFYVKMTPRKDPAEGV